MANLIILIQKFIKKKKKKENHFIKNFAKLPLYGREMIKKFRGGSRNRDLAKKRTRLPYIMLLL